MIIAVLGLLCIIAGILMWGNRHRILPYPAIQILILLLFVTTTATLVLLDIQDIPFAYKFGDNQSAPLSFSPYWLLLMFPAMLTMFHVQERAMKKTDPSSAA